MPKTLLGTIAAGGFPVSVQIDPPQDDTDPRKFLEKLAKLKAAGVEFVDINTKADISSLDTLLLACLCQSHGFSAIPHLSPRHESYTGLVKRTFTAYNLYGLREALIISGDPPDHQIEKFYGDLKSPDAAHAINSLYKLRVLGNICPDLKIGAAFNHNAPDIERELRRLKIKDERMADFYMTQVAFTEKEVDRLISMMRSVTYKPIIIGIWPILHHRTLKNIRAGKIDGVVLPEKMAQAGGCIIDEDDVRKWGRDEALKLIEKIKTIKEVSGIYLVAPRREPDLILDVFGQICG